jgi:hypothetical protein
MYQGWFVIIFCFKPSSWKDHGILKSLECLCMSLHNKNVSAYQQVVKINSECLSHLLACFAFRTLGVCHCITNWLTTWCCITNWRWLQTNSSNSTNWSIGWLKTEQTEHGQTYECQTEAQSEHGLQHKNWTKLTSIH